MLQSNLDMVGISKFILTRILASPDIAAEFAHPTVPHLYKEGKPLVKSSHFMWYSNLYFRTAVAHCFCRRVRLGFSEMV